MTFEESDKRIHDVDCMQESIVSLHIMLRMLLYSEWNYNRTDFPSKWKLRSYAAEYFWNLKKKMDSI